MSNQIKTLHFITSLARGGRERQLATIVANTDPKLFPTKILFLNSSDDSYINEYGLAEYTIQIKSKRRYARLKEIHHIITNEKPDVIYAWGNGEAMSILLLKYFHNFQFINGSIRHGIRSKKASHYLRSIILHLSKNVIANSKAGLRANNLNKGKVIYNGVDEKFILPLAGRMKRKKELTGISNKTPILISVANLTPYKDYFSVLKALKLLKESNHSFIYIIIGKGPLQEQITTKAKEYGLNKCVRIVNNTENVADYLKISDVFIHSSKGEGCSNAILEAMAAGLPIIASNTGGTPELINDNNGFLFDYKDHNQIFKRLDKCLTNSSNCTRMGLISKDIIKEKFTVKSMMSNYYSIITEVVK